MPECLGSFCLTPETIQAVRQGAGVGCVSVLRGSASAGRRGEWASRFSFLIVTITEERTTWRQSHRNSSVLIQHVLNYSALDSVLGESYFIIFAMGANL